MQDRARSPWLMDSAAPQILRLRFPAAAAGELQAAITGTVVVSGADGYLEARQGFVTTFDGFPQIVVFCETFRDVALALDFARHYDLTVTCRAGGHSTAGYSVGQEMVLDVSRINHVLVDPVARRAVVGAGTRFGKLNAVLDQYRLHVPGGGCATVAVAGYVLGGGYGFTSLMHGMNCDSVEEMVVALADGTIVVASQATNADLFWALRGGTGNNFGVLLQVTYRLHDVWQLWGFGIHWDLADGPQALAEIQRHFTGPGVPANLGYQCHLYFLDDKPKVLMRGVYRGAPEEAKRVLAPALATRGASLDIERRGSYFELNDFLELYKGASLPIIPVGAVRALADSRYIARTLSADEWGTLTKFFGRSPNTGNFIGLEAYGGRISAVGRNDTAFVHRDASFDVFTWIFWLQEAEHAAAVAYTNEFAAVLGKLGNGEAYQNYPRRENAAYREMYWAENFETLLAIKQKYDPERRFDFQQAVAAREGENESAGSAAQHAARLGGPLFADVSAPILQAPQVYPPAAEWRRRAGAARSGKSRP